MKDCKPKHTAGPWIAKSAFVSNSPNVNVVTNGEYGSPNIAIVDTEANVRLIAAAPEMFEVLEEFLRCGHNAGHNLDLITLVENVVTKVRGE